MVHDSDGTTLEIRPLTSRGDFLACVALQRDIWGPTFDGVSATMLQAGTHVGAILAGAFDADGALAGFVFGLTGVDASNAIVHWSHILGVRPELRDTGIGRSLKEYQRRELARRHIGEMFWTYDPLIAKNAHFNLNVLGARVVRYVPDMYGDTGSPLHHGLPTDRLLVLCDTSPPGPAASLTLDAADVCTPVLTPHPRVGDRAPSPNGTSAVHLRVEIPADFPQVLATAPSEASVWHTATREHFRWALANGYSVVGLRRDPATSRTFYLFELVQP